MLFQEALQMLLQRTSRTSNMKWNSATKKKKSKLSAKCFCSKNREDGAEENGQEGHIRQGS